jgi:hypothetical protein
MMMMMATDEAWQAGVDYDRKRRVPNTLKMMPTMKFAGR